MISGEKPSRKAAGYSDGGLLSMRHFIDFNDMIIEEWEELYALCGDIIASPLDFADALRGRTMASLFFEPSTRTSFSFQSAMLKLGGGVFGFSDPRASSVSKGERLRDTIAMCSGYAEAVVIRSPVEGSAKAASLFSSSPVINAGDGGHLHPTQTLTDLVTIRRLRGSLESMNIGLCGDLKYGRTVHSLIKAMSRFKNITFYLISPRELSIPPYIRSFLNENRQKYLEVTGLEATMPTLDVLYMTRIQRERFNDVSEYERFKNVYVLNQTKLKNAKNDLLIMHPLPRVDEIHMDVDADRRAVYFRQAEFGMYVRMALLLTLCRLPREYPPAPAPFEGRRSCANLSCVTASEEYLLPLTGKIGGKTVCAYCEKEIPSSPGRM